jgi:hypothetical protein
MAGDDFGAADSDVIIEPLAAGGEDLVEHGRDR